MRTLICEPYAIELFAEKGSQGIVYAVMDGQSAENIWRLVSGHKLALAAVSGVDSGVVPMGSTQSIPRQ